MTFDRIVQVLTESTSRRTVLRSLALGMSGRLLTLGGASGLAVEDKATAAARQKQHNDCPRSRRCKKRCCRRGETCKGGRCVKKQPPVHVRRSVHSLDESGPALTALARGIAVMKARESSDPTSWIFQANIHGTNDGAGANWNQCTHGSFFFLAWHRMYLYWFERILRKASGNPSLALPYWDYSESDQRIVPRPFRTPSSSLYVAQRNADVNAGQPPPAENAWMFDHSPAFETVNFFHTGSGTSFGGLQVSEALHSGGGAGQLENTPHNQVHSWVGGGSGWMGTVAMAARDPLFWLHHANIDRLWKRWLDQAGGRANPTGDGDWMNDTFTFFDENGTEVTMSGKQIVDTAQQLNYRYDDDGAASGAAAARREKGASAAGKQSVKELGKSKGAGGVDLGTDPVTVPIGLGAALPDAGASSTERRADAGVVLTLEGIQGTGVLGVAFEVYVNLPKDQQPSPRDDAFVGGVSLFGLQPQDAAAMGMGHTMMPAALSFDITGAVAGRRASGREVTVTLVPVNLDASRRLPKAPLAHLDSLVVSIVQ
jgi:hypothetical protein